MSEDGADWNLQGRTNNRRQQWVVCRWFDGLWAYGSPGAPGSAFGASAHWTFAAPIGVILHKSIKAEIGTIHSLQVKSNNIATPKEPSSVCYKGNGGVATMCDRLKIGPEKEALDPFVQL